MAIRAWSDGDIRLAVRLLQWAKPSLRTVIKPMVKESIEFDAA